MMGLTIVTGQLLPGHNRTQSVEFHAIPNTSHKYIRRTGMIDVAKIVPSACPVNGFPILKFDDSDAGLVGGSSPSLSQTD